MKIPPLACDCHMHVFGPPAKYPGAPGRLYSPTDMPLSRYTPMARRLGLERVVLVQPSAYGTDNRCLLDTLREHPVNMRAIAVIDTASISDAELDAMHALGVRGTRLNLLTPRIDSAEACARLLEPVASRIGRLGWHIQIYADSSIIAAVTDVIRGLAVPVVLDHMAGVRVEHGSGDANFAAALRLLGDGGCWVKVSGADIVSRSNTALGDAAPFMRALIAANPERVVWGTDWPHLLHQSGATGDAAPPAGYRPVDESALLRLLEDCVPDEATLRAILADNPHRVYDF